MNLSNLFNPQFWQHNLRYGENSRKRNEPQHMEALGFLQKVAMSQLVMPDQTRVWILDISHWNIPPVALKYMKDLYGLQGVIIKGYDGSVKARYCDDHIRTAREAELPIGFYDWLYPAAKVSINSQTTAWANQYLAEDPKLGVHIDAEWTTYAGIPAYPNATDLRNAHDSFRTKTGAKAGTYTAAGYANEYLKGFDWSKEELWIAHYGVSKPTLPTGASTYTLWQFTAYLDGHQLDRQ